MPKTVLIVVTAHDRLGDTGKATGYNVPETALPWKVFTEAGYRVEFAAPGEGTPRPDGADRSDPVQREFLDDPELAARLADPLRPGQLAAGDYDAVFFAGGHGTMWDFPDDEALARLTRGIYESEGAVAAVCHGPAALTNLKLSDGAFLVAGKHVTAFTDAEEAAVGLTEVVPFLLQTTLGERGARISGAENFAEHIVVDGRLVTGQNPASAKGVAEELVKVLAGRNS